MQDEQTKQILENVWREVVEESEKDWQQTVILPLKEKIKQIESGVNLP